MKVIIALSCLWVVKASCPNDCSGNGNCNTYSACDCYRNFMGADCSERVCGFGHSFIDTPTGDLNADGRISTSRATYRVWEAYPTNHAHAIAQSSAGNISDFDEAHFYMECSNKGTCNRATGECQCFPGYTGEACSRTACPNDCSGHGLCRRLIDIVGIDYNAWDAYKTQRCVCDAGYKGTDCSLQKCPMGDDPITRLNNRNEVQANGNDGLLKMGDTFLFSLEFTDEMGDSWITESINLFDFSNLEVNVKQALESLPNKVVQDIEPSNETECSGNSEWSDTGFNVTFLKNSGAIPLMRARYRFGNTIKTYTHGNKENDECSNRGLCDNGTGQCKCFAGFTEHDCSVQNALSSGS
eukprot:GSMAST32.ASY1.ANO1.2553.1 assembled CDS